MLPGVCTRLTVLFTLFVTVLQLQFSSHYTTATKVYHVIPKQDSICPVQLCLTLSQFCNDSSSYLDSNISLFIHPGNHSCEKVSISYIENLSIVSESQNAQIDCGQSRIFLYSIGHIVIQNLEFVKCGITIKYSMTSIENTVFRQLGIRGSADTSASLILINSITRIIACEFKNIYAMQFGAVVLNSDGTLDIYGSNFSCNTGDAGGGVLNLENSNTTITSCQFNNNIATGSGGVVFAYNGTLTIDGSSFSSNVAEGEGGAMYIALVSSVTIHSCQFYNNNARNFGGVLSAIESILEFHDIILVNNSADQNAVLYFVNSIGSLLGNANISNNHGSLMARNSTITITGNAIFSNCTPPATNKMIFEEGGAITAFQSNVYISGVCTIKRNHAENGGAILAIESKLFVNGQTIMENNTATMNGGGISLRQSELNCQWESILKLSGNRATEKGGGVHLVSSIIKATVAAWYSLYNFGQYRLLFDTYIGAIIELTENSAMQGGGLYLETNSKFYVLKDLSNTDSIYIHERYVSNYVVKFAANTADYGGAMYINDYSNSGICTSTTTTERVHTYGNECFIQVLALDGLSWQSGPMYTTTVVSLQNHVTISGSTLYGGLLDRCTLNPFTEVYLKYSDSFDSPINNNIPIDGVHYFNNITYSKSTKASKVISSHPVQVCFCITSISNCSYHQPLHIQVKKGEAFAVPLTAIDQTGHSIHDVVIQTHLSYKDSTGSLGEGQLTQKVHKVCTDLIFNVYSFNNSEELILYAADGPCKDAEPSTRKVSIQFLPCTCPTGFQPSNFDQRNCVCECHRDIGQYVKCNATTESFVRQSNVWIDSINYTEHMEYVVYPHCPYDYCLPISLSTPVNLNQPGGGDAQCAFNHTGLLCGSCQSSLSLSLGSSRCLSCPENWPVLLVSITVAAILAGIALVILLLTLNMTVAVGTINGFIFYANVVIANQSILLPFSEPNYVTIFISWLNLELGFDTCYFEGMDAYTKSWLQLAFPSFVILLVVFIIIVSNHSSKFTRLIAKKNPVATLATLVLLSYTRFLEAIISALSFGIITYPDGSRELVWLPDATVKYLSGKHIALFTIAVFILIFGLIYSVLLFSWQWLLRSPRWMLFKWVRNSKLYTFMETYTAPYIPQYRYWTGLLLFIRAMLYLIQAVNISGDSRVQLTSILITMSCIMLFKMMSTNRLYKMWLIYALELLLYFNIILFATLSWFFLETSNEKQKVVAHVSVDITIALLLVTIFYHIYTHTNIFMKIRKALHRIHELSGIINHSFINKYQRVPPQWLNDTVPTHSVVEIPSQGPDSEDVDMQNILNCEYNDVFKQNDQDIQKNDINEEQA